MKAKSVAVAFIEWEGRVFLQRRAEHAAWFPGMWELPGGKVEIGESPREALERELLEELAWKPKHAEFWVALDHTYSHAHIILHAFRCPMETHTDLRTDLAWGWFQWHEILALPLPEATRILVLDRLAQDSLSSRTPGDPSGTDLL